jgi:hypothetical protein
MSCVYIYVQSVAPVMAVVQSERPAAPYVPEECLKRGMSEELDQIKTFSEELGSPPKMSPFRRIKCKFKTTVKPVTNK